MRLRVAVIAGLASVAGAAGLAHADDDARDLFGLGTPAKSATAERCDEPDTFGCVRLADPLDEDAPHALSTWLPARYLRRLPVANTTHDAVAHYALGAGRDEGGPAFGGATGLENRWTIEGAPTDSLRTGAAETRVPLTFLDGIRVRAGGFAARDRTSTGGTIDARLRRGGTTHELEVGVWGGLTGTNRRRPVPVGSYSLRRLTIATGPEASASVVATGPLGRVLGGRAWYAAGIAPTLGSAEPRWIAARLVDRDGDGQIDGLPGEVATETITDTINDTINDTRKTVHDWFIPVMARAGLERGAHQVELTLLGHTRRATRFLANATPRAAGVDRTAWIGDGIASWKGRWAKTRAHVQLAWHRSEHREAAHDAAAAGVPQLLGAYIPPSLPDDPQLAALCNDMTYPLIPQCPVPFGYFASAGAGPLVDSVGDRPTATAELAHHTGRHVVRVGATLEDARLITRSRFTGGEQQRTLFDGHLDRLRYVDGECGDEPGTPCAYTDVSELRYRTRYTAAYLEDTWEPEPGLRVDGGVRWEMMWVGPRLHFSDQFAPRAGLSWDVLGGGRSRLWTSMGRSHVMLPAGLGATVIRRDATVHDATNPLGASRSTDAGAAYSVAPGIEPMAQDELTAGIEIGLPRTFRLIAWAQGRWLRRGLETTPTGFDNPGRTGGLPARRATQQLAVELATAPTGNLTLRAGYVAGRTVGNFLGAHDPRQGAILYDGADFNTAFASPNDLGQLPTDVGHRLYVEGDRRGRLGPLTVGIATRLSLASGRPRNAFANTDVGWIALVPRGSLGRGPMLAQANLRFAASWRGFDLTLDLFNAFDRTGATLRDETYTEGLVRPIVGGTYEDLIFLKSTDGSDVRRRTAFGLPLVFQGPISGVLGIQRAF